MDGKQTDLVIMRYFPLFFDVKGMTVLITGGGHQALTRLRLLAKSEAGIKLVAPVVAPEIIDFASGQDIKIIMRRPKPIDMLGANYVFAASGDPASDRLVADMAQAGGIPVNAIDQPGLCDFLMPALVDRDPVVVAIGTEGKAPLLARDIRAKFERELPARIGAVAQFAGAWRKAVANTLPRNTRRSFWRQFLSGLPGQKMLAGETVAAKIDAIALLANHSRNALGQIEAAKGHVWLIGAGPGDPDLLTLKAHRLLQDADVVIHDRCVHRAILDGARRDARFIDLGNPSIQRNETVDILIREARAGNIVVRLVNGDPFIYDHDGVDLAALEQAGIEATLVPGISVAMACAVSANLPPADRRTNRVAAINMDGHLPAYIAPPVTSDQPQFSGNTK
jgi:uroporphyrin-III C-methyltransferase / precorrin-2 dehydrogenase / sirohydrochlorin ferrochelatase